MRVRVRSWHGVASWLWVANDENCGICRMAFNGCCPDSGAAALPHVPPGVEVQGVTGAAPGTVRDGCGPRAAELPGAAGSPRHAPVQSGRDLVPGPHGVRGRLSQHRWLRSDNKCAWTGTISPVFAGAGGAAESPCRGGGTHRGLGHAGAAPPGVDPGKPCQLGERGLLVLWAQGDRAKPGAPLLGSG
ncbi:anaphase-promoting complex subunit 11 isoform X1 [Cygnus olor]|uniref:anaphase-promoting complex subunit 11 isoform X1 n=1 Tax=Cygnus olor TaxID=8869 RepID=UPI001ADE8DBE|nr:anaphase-promoting complex subunit 11 isoform X1 [Cygnus olor]